MMKLHLIYLALCSLTQAAYVSRMAVMNRVRPSPAAFRPGVMLQRPWVPHRLGQAGASSQRPYVIYRQHNPQNRYAVKQFAPTRSVYSAPWRASRPVATTEKQFIRAASVISHNGGIHTIPAPNLSLKEKPIVVVEATSQRPKIFEVTEKHPESIFQLAKIEQPIGFSKSIPSPDIQSLVQNGAGFQLSQGGPETGFSTIALSQPAQFQHQQLPQQSQFQHQFVQQSVVQPVVQQNSLIPQQFSVQRINTITNPPDMIQARPEGIVIPPSALYQPDPAFLQKLQTQLLQRFPGIEFVPYVTEFNAPSLAQGQNQFQQSQLQGQPQGQLQGQFQGQPQGHLLAQESQIQVQTVSPQSQPAQQFQPQIQLQTQAQVQSIAPSQVTQEQPLFLLQNEQVTKQTPSSLAPSEFQRTVVQRETVLGTVTLVPVSSPINNITERSEATTATQPPVVDIEEKADPVQETTTMKYVLQSSTPDSKTTPIYYAQVDQNVDNAVANGFYSAINDVRAAAVRHNDQNTGHNATQPQENVVASSPSIDISTSTIDPDLQPYFIQKSGDKDAQNTTANEIQPLLGAPFSKPQDSTVAYTLVRADDKENKITNDGSVYAGQLVEASVSEDQDFNKARAQLPTRRAPIRLVNRPENKEPTANTPTKAVKAKIPPRSKLTFDDKTGEPVLRVYASYVNTPTQKEALNTKLTSSKRVREAVYRKQDPADWKTTSAADKAQNHDGSHVTQFGLKLRSRSDDYMPLFDDYQD